MIKVRKVLNEFIPYQLSAVPRQDKIKLNLNENTKGCSPQVIKAISKINPYDIAIYPEYQGLIKKLADYLSVAPENILLTDGGDEAIRCIIDSYIEKGDEIIIPAPNYSMFVLLSKLREAKIVEVLYNKDFSFPLKNLLDTITGKTKMVIISNPNSPLGSSIGKNDLVKILNKTDASDSAVLLDEAYQHFANKTHIKLINEFDNLFIVQTFSKVFGLAGLRLGYIVSAKENIDNLRKVKLPYSVNSLAVIGGCAALKDKKYIHNVVKETAIEKRFLYKGLKNLAKEVRMTDTNFLIANFGNCHTMIHKRLADRNILVKNLDSFPLLKGFLRITVGTHNENKILLETLKEIIPPEAVLFDMDGVLVDVSASYRIAIKKTAEYYLKKRISLKEIQSYKTRSGYNNEWNLTEAIILSHGLKVSKNEIIKTFQHFYSGVNKNEKWLIDTDTLNEIKQHYKLGIVTGRPRNEANYALKRFRAEKYFDTVITMEDVKGKEKPNPYGINLALKKLGVKRAVYIGDNIDDIKSAVSANVTPIGIIESHISNKQRVAESYRKLGAKYILKNVNDILEVLK